MSFSLIFAGYGLGVIFDDIVKPLIYKELINLFSSRPLIASTIVGLVNPVPLSKISPVLVIMPFSNWVKLILSAVFLNPQV